MAPSQYPKHTARAVPMALLLVACRGVGAAGSPWPGVQTALLRLCSRAVGFAPLPSAELDPWKIDGWWWVCNLHHPFQLFRWRCFLGEIIFGEKKSV